MKRCRYKPFIKYIFAFNCCKFFHFGELGTSCRENHCCTNQCIQVVLLFSVLTRYSPAKTVNGRASVCYRHGVKCDSQVDDDRSTNCYCMLEKLGEKINEMFHKFCMCCFIPTTTSINTNLIMRL